MSVDHSDNKNIEFAFFLNFGFTLLEFIVGFYVNSVAILSDAIHDLGDSISLVIAWILAKISKKKSTKKFTYGYKRFSTLGAFINCFILLFGSVYIIFEAVERIQNPQPVNALGMMLFAIIGVLVNGVSVLRLHKGKSLNEKVLFWHLLEDLLGWVAILVGAVFMYFFKWESIDAYLSLFISLLIIISAIKNLKKVLMVFLQSTPKEIDLNQLKSDFLVLPEIDSIQNFHAWSLDGESHVITTHFKVNNTLTETKDLKKLKKQLKNIAKDYSFVSSTFEFIHGDDEKDEIL